MTAPVPSPRRRLFLAVGLDEETTDLLAAHLRASLPGGIPGRLAPPSNWHLTMRFLGWTTDDEADRIIHQVASSVATGAFRIRFGAMGAFPKPRRATVVWLGVAAGNDELAALAAVCEEAAVGTGFSPEDRPFHAHVTLSRVRPPEDVDDLITGFPPFDVRMSVSEISLYESRLRPGGAEYHVVDRVALPGSA